MYEANKAWNMEAAFIVSFGRDEYECHDREKIEDSHHTTDYQERHVALCNLKKRKLMAMQSAQFRSWQGFMRPMHAAGASAAQPLALATT